jgi:hypothetical protein
MIRKRTVTLTGVGADGSAVDTETLTFGRPGFIRAIAIDHSAGQAATADVTIKADSASGNTLFTSTSSATDITAKPVAMPGMDETGAASAATDIGSGGLPFGTGLYFDLAQGDSGETSAVTVWVEL